MQLPSIVPIRQTRQQPAVADVVAETRRQWLTSSLPQRLAPGATVAVGVGSRGIANLNVIVKATIDVLREMKFRPFVVAAMGSHGKATAEGQRELLAEYGVTEAALGVEVRTQMDVVQLGVNSWSEPVWWDQNAAAADGVVTISRVKPHTDFRGPIESGLVKMAVIGLGKETGAAQHHRWGVRGLNEMMFQSMNVILDQTKYLGGLAVLENTAEETAWLQFVDRDRLLNEEPLLLDEARKLMGRLPFDPLDLLIIGEIGKNYSGSGIDPNVIGRLAVETVSEVEKPTITRIAALDLSPESHGNGTGCGLADVVSQRLLDAIDPAPTRKNILTACFMLRTKLPFGFPTDREVIEVGVQTCWQPFVDQLRMAVIPNTLEVNEIWVSLALAAEATTRSDLSVVGEPRPIPFDESGNLNQELLFPHCIRARRGRQQT